MKSIESRPSQQSTQKLYELRKEDLIDSTIAALGEKESKENPLIADLRKKADAEAGRLTVRAQKTIEGLDEKLGGLSQTEQFIVAESIIKWEQSVRGKVGSLRKSGAIETSDIKADGSIKRKKLQELGIDGLTDFTFSKSNKGRIEVQKEEERKEQTLQKLSTRREENADTEKVGKKRNKFKKVLENNGHVITGAELTKTTDIDESVDDDVTEKGESTPPAKELTNIVNIEEVKAVLKGFGYREVTPIAKKGKDEDYTGAEVISLDEKREEKAKKTGEETKNIKLKRRQNKFNKQAKLIAKQSQRNNEIAAAAKQAEQVKESGSVPVSNNQTGEQIGRLARLSESVRNTQGGKQLLATMAAGAAGITVLGVMNVEGISSAHAAENQEKPEAIVKGIPEELTGQQSLYPAQAVLDTLVTRVDPTITERPAVEESNTEETTQSTDAAEPQETVYETSFELVETIAEPVETVNTEVAIFDSEDLSATDGMIASSTELESEISAVQTEEEVPSPTIEKAPELEKSSSLVGAADVIKNVFDNNQNSTTFFGQEEALKQAFIEAGYGDNMEMIENTMQSIINWEGSDGGYRCQTYVRLAMAAALGVDPLIGYDNPVNIEPVEGFGDFSKVYTGDLQAGDIVITAEGPVLHIAIFNGEGFNEANNIPYTAEKGRFVQPIAIFRQQETNWLDANTVPGGDASALVSASTGGASATIGSIE